MKKTLLFATLLALTAPFAQAADSAPKCDCSKKCHKQCQMGHGKNCKCQHCGCAKGDKCGGGCDQNAA